MDERPTSEIEDDAPISAQDALAIIRTEQTRSAPDIGPFFLLWGVLWLVIGVGWFGAGTGYLSATAAGLTTAAAIVVGSALSTLLGTRIGRGVSGPSSTFGRMYGVAWFVAMVGTGAMVGGLSRFGGPAVGVLAPALFVFVVGVMYAIGGAFWRSRTDYALGLVVQLVAVVAVFTAAPWNSLVIGIGGGGALIVVGLLRRREQRS